MKFKFHMFNESYDEFGNISERKEKDVEVNAETCCEAHVIATKGNREWTIASWESLDKSKTAEFVPENEFEKKAWEKAKKMMADEKKAKEKAAAQANDNKKYGDKENEVVK